MVDQLSTAQIMMVIESILEQLEIVEEELTDLREDLDAQANMIEYLSGGSNELS